MKRLFRSDSDKKIAGVCGGLADYFNIDSTLVRAGFVILGIPGGVPGVLPYIILWAIMPSKEEVNNGKEN